MEEIIVSVLVLAFNHERYIEECLESLVKQRTSFPFEVLIHDDASTDKTPAIIKEYCTKYPDIIIPVFQTINQYSQGIRIDKVFLYPKARGKYIAICEGDDYWIDPLKLQKQVDAMENHPEIDMCAHAASIVKDGKITGTLAAAQEERVFDTGDVIRGGGGMFATNSLLYRKSMLELEPRFIQYYSFDYTMQIWGSLRGGVLYLPDNMSAYRVMVSGSWSSLMQKNRNAKICHLKRLEIAESIMLGEIDIKFRQILENRMRELHILISQWEGNFHELRKQEYRTIIKRYTFVAKLKLYFKCIYNKLI